MYYPLQIPYVLDQNFRHSITYHEVNIDELSSVYMDNEIQTDHRSSYHQSNTA